jgi:hypothetical protein
MKTATVRSVGKVYLLSDIVKAMMDRSYIGLVDPAGKCHIGMVNGLQVEDGSGKNYIVTLYANGKASKLFVKAS